MPKQILRVEIDYPPLDGDGDVKPPPAEWDIMSALDDFEDDEDQGNGPFYTRSVRITALGPVKECENDEASIEEWHQENCSPEECTNPATQCVYQGDES